MIHVLESMAYDICHQHLQGLDAITDKQKQDSKSSKKERAFSLFLF
jgi:hypothetical protein